MRREADNLLLSDTVSWPIGERLEDFAVVVGEPRVLAKPALWMKLVGQGKELLVAV